MRFYRLEKPNMIKTWAFAIVKGLAISLIIILVGMLLAGYKFMIVTSGSMEPVLPVGSLVIVTPCDYDELELGDIVTMDAGGIYLTHRIVGKYNKSDPENSVLLPEDMSDYEGEAWVQHIEASAEKNDAKFEDQDWWVTKGDATFELDGALTDNIVGKVYDSHAFSWIGLCVRYIRANLPLVIIMGMLALAFIWTLGWLKRQLTPDDIEVYDNDEE